MTTKVDLQIAGKFNNIPTRKQFQKWVSSALQPHSQTKNEVVIRIVSEKESAVLNEQYRHKKGPTNVLSFPFAIVPGVTSTLLGDLIICAPLVVKEAREQNKAFLAHWAHLVVHGVLHLLGYDHIKKQDATRMENLEIKIMAELDYPNPYLVNTQAKIYKKKNT